jgi:putative transposase
MPRPLRIEYPGALYHVMNRGINRMNIFMSDENREIFIEFLKDIRTLFGVKIHSYCLMDNHYHLLLETPNANLGKAMRHLSGLYTQSFNRLQKRDGSLFRGRYKAILIEAERYLLTVSRYIHLNPVEAKIVCDAKLYKWSSYKDFIKTNPPSWLYTDFILSFFGDKKNYAEFVAEGIDEKLRAFYESHQSSSILGDQKFIIEKINKLDSTYQMDALTEVNKAKNSLDVSIILALIAKYLNINITLLTNPSRNNSHYRALTIYILRNLTELSHAKISKYFIGLKPAGVSSAIKRSKKLIINDAAINKMYSFLIEKLVRDD